ncbi:MAG: uroporphyrinogen-III C-methyltransferase, partial [Nitrososphaerota archaeon]|nr:uroporphyrinogen-III C-methyltransferase [Nitrososphaerales archaeon]MDW8045597.1 uroporphyrinogen-III C-methyltransferase [Nitrososphaerota archaeon]
MSVGKVYLVGAGPGDPELITLKGLKVLRKADVVIYDRLVNVDTLNYTRRAKELICVGKEKGESWKQERINELLIEKAKQYKIVVRLKNGDPMLFGRGAEECEALKEAGIPYEIIPGVTSALAAAAYARIPITHRDYSSTLAIVTGHRKEDYENLDYLIPVFKGVDTTIILMGVSNLERIIDAA